MNERRAEDKDETGTEMKKEETIEKKKMFESIWGKLSGRTWTQVRGGFGLVLCAVRKCRWTPSDRQ